MYILSTEKQGGSKLMFTMATIVAGLTACLTCQLREFCCLMKQLQYTAYM